MIRILGIGMGPQHVTPEVADALRGCDYVLAASKRDGDELLAIRRAICEEYGVELVPVPDPARDREPVGDGGYVLAVEHWQEARVAAYRAVIESRGGTVGFLVWGDPSLYDSTIRIVSQLGEEWDVLPGVSAPQILAARHRIVLDGDDEQVHFTTARRLRADIAAGQTNLLVYLTGPLDLAGLEDWQIWWGANLGTPSEELVAGPVGGVLPAILAARERARATAGWVMDLYLLRRPAR